MRSFTARGMPATILLAMTVGACGSEAKKDGTSVKSAEAQVNSGTSDGSASEDSPRGSSGSPADVGSTALTDEQAFIQTVYPLVREHCSGCHERSQTPFFAAATEAPALKAIQDTGKIDFDQTDNSRLVKRLAADNHNCWSSCAADGATMLAAIKSWRELTKRSEATAAKKIETAALKLAEASDRDKQTDPSTMAMEAEAATLTAPMQMVSNTTASGGAFLSVPAGNGGAAASAATATGTAVFTFDVKVAGTYSVWGLVNAPAAANNRFFARIDAGAFTTWVIPVNADKFTWNQAKSATARVLSAALTVGTHTVELRRARETTAIDVIALTSNATFDGSQASFGKSHVLRFDLSAMLNKANTWLEIEMEDLSARAYKFRNPTILTPDGKVHAKGLRVLVNGVYDPQDATYNLVDKTVAAPGESLSPAAMVVIKDKGAADDLISFTFDALEVAP